MTPQIDYQFTSFETTMFLAFIIGVVSLLMVFFYLITRSAQMDSRGSKMLHKCIYPGELFSGVAFSKRRKI